jgi:hypothetical protein
MAEGTELSSADKVRVAEKILHLNRLLERHDRTITDTFIRILKSPNPQAARLRQLLKEIANG